MHSCVQHWDCWRVNSVKQEETNLLLFSTAAAADVDLLGHIFDATLNFSCLLAVCLVTSGPPSQVHPPCTGEWRQDSATLRNSAEIQTVPLCECLGVWGLSNCGMFLTGSCRRRHCQYVIAILFALFKKCQKCNVSLQMLPQGNWKILWMFRAMRAQRRWTNAAAPSSNL